MPTYRFPIMQGGLGSFQGRDRIQMSSPNMVKLGNKEVWYYDSDPIPGQTITRTILGYRTSRIREVSDKEMEFDYEPLLLNARDHMRTLFKNWKGVLVFK